MLILKEGQTGLFLNFCPSKLLLFGEVLEMFMYVALFLAICSTERYPYFLFWLQKLWINQAWIFLARSITSGRLRNVCAQTVAEALLPPALPHTWRSALVWVGIAAVLPIGGEDMRML